MKSINLLFKCLVGACLMLGFVGTVSANATCTTKINFSSTIAHPAIGTPYRYPTVTLHPGQFFKSPTSDVVISGRDSANYGAIGPDPISATVKLGETKEAQYGTIGLNVGTVDVAGTPTALAPGSPIIPGKSAIQCPTITVTGTNTGAAGDRNDKGQCNYTSIYIKVTTDAAGNPVCKVSG